MRKILLLIAAMAILGSASAQTNKQTQKLTFGPKVGINFSDIRFDFVDATGFGGLKAAFSVGAFVEYRTCNWFALSADLLYSRQGSNTELNLEIGSFKLDTKLDYRLQYINVPILANFYVTKGLALKTGIQPGFLVGATREASLNGQTKTDNVKSTFKSMDIAIPVGLSYTFKMGLVIDARYNISLTDIATDKMKAEFAEEDGDILKKAYNSVFTLSLGWKF